MAARVPILMIIGSIAAMIASLSLRSVALSGDFRFLPLALISIISVITGAVQIRIHRHPQPEPVPVPVRVRN
jgi:hypothetical protein